MNNKLVKVCALVFAAVISQNECIADDSPSTSQANIVGHPYSRKIGIVANVKATVTIECSDNIKEISLYQQDGNIEPEENRTVSYNITSLAAKCKISIEGLDKVESQEDRLFWKIVHKGNKEKYIKASILFDDGNTSNYLKEGSITLKEGVETFSLIVEPEELTSSSTAGDYHATLTIKIVAEEQ